MVHLSLITVVYNDLVGLRRTVRSIDTVINSLPDPSLIEHIIIDGGSTDGFIEYICELKDLRPINTTVVSEPDEGIYDAMNKGVKCSSGKAVVFLNAGDEIHPNCKLSEILKDISEIFQQPKVMGVAYCAVMKIGRKEFSVQSRNVLQKNPRMPSIHQAMIYKRSILLLEPFDTKFRICGDYDNFTRIINSFGYFHPVQRTFVIFHAGGLSSQAPLKLIRESFYISSTRFRLTILERLKVFIRLLVSLTFVQLMLLWERKHLD